jgi:glycosyltransferase involved in cell wall biosynthesis
MNASMPLNPQLSTVNQKERPVIAVVFEFATLNGGERSMLAVFERCRGVCDVVALAPADGPLIDELHRLGIRHQPFSLRDSAGERLTREDCCARLIQTLQPIHPDLVHANSLSMGRLTGAVASELDAPCIAHLRDIIGLSRAAIADLNRNRLLIAVSQATKDFHVAQGLEPAQTRVVYNGVDCNRFHPDNVPPQFLRSDRDLPNDAFIVLTVGQIGLRKGQNLLAEAAGLVRERLPQVHYVFAGSRHSTKRESVEFERNLFDRFESAGLGQRVHWLGDRDDVPALMNCADCLVHPAHQEPLGRVLLEAAAAGLPIIATDVGGTPEIVTNGESARLVPAGDSSALAAALIELHDCPDLCRQYAAAARRRAETHFNADQAAAALTRIWIEQCELRQPTASGGRKSPVSHG